ncbi:MAG: ATP-binding cassette domain-containing protein, partial [Clostridia bacterium]|nr:ATP-binding cassette domain-containing protein [Clostridia bacterium]
MKELLILDNVNYSYNTEKTETHAIENLSFKIGEGEFVALIGPSGCGKTTVLSLIAGLLTPTDGKIILNGNEVNGCSNDIGYMLQRDELFPWRTIEKNVFLPLEIKKMNTQKNRDYAISLLDKYGLKDFKKSYPHQLSGGMRQR